MAKKSLNRLLSHIVLPTDIRIDLLQKQDSYRQFLSRVLARCQTQFSIVEKRESRNSNEGKHGTELSSKLEQNETRIDHLSVKSYSLDRDKVNDSKWRLELDWLPRVLEPALQLCRSALPSGNAEKQSIPPSSRSIAEIFASLQKSKIGIQDWSLGDVAIGLYLCYLQQASADKVDDFKGVQISSDSIVQDLIYHTELAKGCYKGNVASLARHSMLQERNVLKFVKDSSILRPGYYVGVDVRHRLVILGIRGTHTVYDLITDMVSSSDQEITLEGFSTHFGTSEAARWFLQHEMGTIRKCLEKHEGFRLRLVGHSLGGAAAALLAIMLRRKTQEELGFNPDIVSAVGIGTPPCVSRELAESCASYVSNVVLQDDIIPRLSAASLMRLRNEVLQTDWMRVLEKEDWKSFVGLVTNAKQVVSSVQDAARKFAEYAKFRSKTNDSELSLKEDPTAITPAGTNKAFSDDVPTTLNAEETRAPAELFTPGTQYFIRRNLEHPDGSSVGGECYSLWRRDAGEHFQRIVLSGNFISDHKCDNHYYALRDVLKGLPGPTAP
ncbi:hypothetical protein H6P81_017331 [Aristolochia fimbriata]|uniref:Fungal lipase-type domain-containing protein n=1 Tax=Aristolochia fimbriata TaxID=158543 RepID=A0AAV7E263_ARIFI|nr:hypothetical protein H6P81_017331 [Aristolochia fimbriata]